MCRYVISDQDLDSLENSEFFENLQQEKIILQAQLTEIEWLAKFTSTKATQRGKIKTRAL